MIVVRGGEGRKKKAAVTGKIKTRRKEKEKKNKRKKVYGK